MSKVLNSIALAVFSSRLSAICEEMGVVLQKSAFSPNIKDRLDYSCAFFDASGYIVSQAAHIPVHLGSMAYAMKEIVGAESWYEGDVLILNDPFKGGTHLPDVTVITPAFHEEMLIGFFACRAHHANIGCDQPGSMPLSRTLDEEGVVIEPTKLFKKGVIQNSVVELLIAIEGDSKDVSDHVLPGDFAAQRSCLEVGLLRLREWLDKSKSDSRSFQDHLCQLNEYGRTLALKSLSELPEGNVQFEDYLDNDGYDDSPVKISLALTVDKGRILLDFSGSSEQVRGNLNCPISVCAASAYYVFASLLPDYVPHCEGVFGLISISAPKGSVLNAHSGSAVASGNVETSMRIVDVVLGALNKIGVSVPAASQGTMNNVAMGNKSWNYYETIGGGMGASGVGVGLSAVQCHMTNSLNTPVESLEMHYPLRISQYSLRAGVGGDGIHKGGDGLQRQYYFKEDAKVTLLTDRRDTQPWGLNGGSSAKSGINALNGEVLPGKVAIDVIEGDILSVSTPGGGGFGAPLAWHGK